MYMYIFWIDVVVCNAGSIVPNASRFKYSSFLKFNIPRNVKGRVERVERRFLTSPTS